MIKGAGGSEGGIGKFLLGLTMMIVGGYLFFDSIRVHSGFSWGLSLFGYGGIQITGGMVLIPVIFGIGIIFYSAKNVIGWLLFCGGLLAMIFGLIRNIRFDFANMSGFDLLVILVLMFGGLGLFMSSLRGPGDEAEPPR